MLLQFEIPPPFLRWLLEGALVAYGFQRIRNVFLFRNRVILITEQVCGMQFWTKWPKVRNHVCWSAIVPLTFGKLGDSSTTATSYRRAIMWIIEHFFDRPLACHHEFLVVDGNRSAFHFGTAKAMPIHPLYKKAYQMYCLCLPKVVQQHHRLSVIAAPPFVGSFLVATWIHS